jgi:hypothetical protein
VISVPKRLRCFLADRQSAVAALTRIFVEEIERLLCNAAGSTRDGDRPSAARVGRVGRVGRKGRRIDERDLVADRPQAEKVLQHGRGSAPWPGWAATMPATRIESRSFVFTV